MNYLLTYALANIKLFDLVAPKRHCTRRHLKEQIAFAKASDFVLSRVNRKVGYSCWCGTWDKNVMVF